MELHLLYVDLFLLFLYDVAIKEAFISYVY
nr:MAG TPA: hypothetical protein [Caudoviricetes sp.]